MSAIRRLRDWEPDVLVLIIIANLLVFAISMYLTETLAPYALPTESTGPSGEALYIMGSNTPHLVLRGQLFRLVTAMLLHANLLHLVMNTIGLINLGRHAQAILGPRRFFTVYATSGLLASVVSLAWYTAKGLSLFGEQPLPLTAIAGSIGASGAICGLLGYLLGYVRHATDPASVMVRRQLIFWTILMLAIGLMPGVPIDNAGHIGGGLSGFAIAVILDGRSALRRAVESRAMALVLIAVVTVGTGWGAASWLTGFGPHARELLPARKVLRIIGAIEDGRSGADARATDYLRTVRTDPEPWMETEAGRALIDYLRARHERRSDPEALDRATRAVADMRTTLGPYF